MWDLKDTTVDRHTWKESERSNTVNRPELRDREQNSVHTTGPASTSISGLRSAKNIGNDVAS